LLGEDATILLVINPKTVAGNTKITNDIHPLLALITTLVSIILMAIRTGINQVNSR
jgi:hypothetical protein